MESVWTPPILIYNSIASASAESPLQSDASKVALNQDGFAQIQTSLLHSSSCDINLKEFPFDSHECNLSFVSQGIPSDFFEFEPEQVFSLADTNPQWLLSGLALDTSETTDPVHNDTFSFLNVRFTMTRLPDFYLRMIAVPIQQLNTLALMAFFIPLKSGERVSSCLSLVLGQTVFQIIIADILPRTSRADSEPILINFVLTSFLTLVCITGGSTITVNLSFQPWRIRHRSSRYVVFHVIGTIPEKEVSLDECKHNEADNSDVTSSDTKKPSSDTEEMTDMEFLAACIDRIFFFGALIGFILINLETYEIGLSSLSAMIR
ncbi:neuronal acetylcholine receptor subunit alpha-9-like [Diadema antillarum]|uniref:neuronal acetylcholine receptor subunit alpha-9-like n=1 Tax=Diadema antillarum TaxID=105358 RepID=UPI003A86673E